jgi:Ni,Fe-hydrogenase III small subunit/Pyruvate/2-oxoacid:ferredoxin oxidoreductase delta subunit
MGGLIPTRLAQGYRTMRYPAGPQPELPARFLGQPVLADTPCPADCRACVQVCPTAAISADLAAQGLALDTGRCLFCGACSTACQAGTIRFGRDYRLASTRRADLLARPTPSPRAPGVDHQASRMLKRSLKLRQVSAGGCNACELDTNVLNTLAWDIARFGIQFVASPRHADGLLITGPVSRNMGEALRKTYEAVPSPKIVVAVGACAVSGGLYSDHPETHGGADALVPVDLYIPGCPPHPLTMLHGLLRFLGRAA